MKECFSNKKFGERALDLIAKANSVIEGPDFSGLCMTVRQLYYQFVGNVWLENTPQNYEALATIISEGREAGMIDWDVIEDRGRVTNSQPTYDSLRGYLNQLNEAFRLDKWKKQKHYVEVMVEKQALEAIIWPICEKWSVPFTANKGYSSVSSMYKRGKFIQSQRDVEGKEVHVLYLGDHDPSGIDMSRDVKDRLERYSDGPVDVVRLGLNHDQVLRHQLPKNPAKFSDSRAAGYVEKFGEHSWELDALKPIVLRSLVENGIKQFVNLESWRAMEAQQQGDQDTLQTIIEELPEAQN
jgi:hypothetical protein